MKLDSGVGEELIGAYGGWIAQQNNLEDWQSYYINIMFKPLPGSAEAIQSQMQEAIENWFYPKLCKRLERHPGRKGRRRFLPKLILFPDFPVYKTKKRLREGVAFNGGLHYNGTISISGRSRLNEDFHAHMTRHHADYAGEKIERFYLKDIFEAQKLSDYAIKSIKCGRAEYECGIFLPKSLSEMSPSHPVGEDTRRIKIFSPRQTFRMTFAKAIYARVCI